MYCGGGHLGFPIDIRNIYFVEDLPMIIPGQFGFNCPSGFREEAFSNIFPIGSNVKLSPVVAASKMAATVGHRLTLDPMGECSNVFFSETTNIIKAKPYMNVHWMVLYKLCVFCSDMKFKMAALAGINGKAVKNDQSLACENKLVINIKKTRITVISTFPNRFF
jgi:hypothetical protein